MADWQPLYRIKFDETHKREGLDTIFRSGTVVWNEAPAAYGVDKYCIEALQKKGIPFIHLNAEQFPVRREERDQSNGPLH